MSSNYDIVVVGIGGIGSAVIHALSRRGARVLGIDARGPAHALGSSHGKTRIIRRAYFEHPDYVPLLDTCYDLWSRLEKDCRETLYLPYGLYLAGNPEGSIVAGVQDAQRLHGFGIEQFDARDARQRWPQFRPDDDMTILFERQAGYLLVENCIRACISESHRHGADLLFDQPIEAWESLGEAGFRIRTGECSFDCGSIVFCAGPWTSALIDIPGVALNVVRKPNFWLETGDPDLQVDRQCPAFGFETRHGFLYGIPSPDDAWLKTGNHDGGKTVDDPSHVDHEIDPVEQEEMLQFVRRYTRSASPTLRNHTVCMYTMSSDSHFILDRHPDFHSVFVAAGFSGHGFKFAPLVGEVVADWSLDGSTRHPVAFLGLDRFR